MATKPPVSNTGPFGLPPGGPWFVFLATGTIQRQSDPVLAAGLVNLGWIGFATQAEAKAELQYSKSHGRPTAGQATADAGNAAKKAAESAASTVLRPLFQANIWIRVGEVVLGLILIAIGVAELTNAVPVATKIARVMK